MGRSLSPPDAKAGSARLPAGTFQHAPSGSTVQIYWSGSTMHHKLRERGLEADYPIAFEIGAGKIGESFLIRAAGHLFQSPASFYSARGQWDVSPGYEQNKLLDFDRSITSDCLSCHSNLGESATSEAIQPISCERCHGPAEQHLRNPIPGSIVNPAKLDRRERDSVCEQCHLEGATAVLNPGKHWTDFRPGQALESIEAHYVYRSTGDKQGPLLAVSHAEQLAVSKCFRGSAGRLWCGTCHDPHGEPVDRKQQIRQICSACHPTSQLASTHAVSAQDCIACHMPRQDAADIAHAPITDHRITRFASTSGSSPGQANLVPWQEPAPDLIQRDLGLAEFYLAKKTDSGEAFQKAYDTLSSVPSASADAAVLAAEGYLLLGSRATIRAIACFQRATLADSANAEYWLDLGVALQAADRASDAEAALRHSIQLAPWDSRAYIALLRLLSDRGQSEEVRDLRSQFLQLVPASILFRSASEPKR